METRLTTESVDAIFSAFKKAEQWLSPEMRAYKLSEYLRDSGFTITRAESSMSEAELERSKS